MTTDLHALDVDTCMRLLSEQHVGRLAFCDDDGPMVLPVNYLYDRGSILFRSDLGTKLGVAEDRERAAFEIDHVDEVNKVGWSVVARGRLIEVVDALELDHVETLGIRPYTRGDGKHHFLRLVPRVITGRLTPIPDKVPPGWFRAAVLGTDAIPAHL